MFKRSMRTGSQKNHAPTSAAQAVLSRRGSTPGFGSTSAGFLQLSGLIRGDLRFQSRLEASRKTRLFPKSNRMPHPPHSVKVETEVVDGIQHLRQKLIGCIEMAEIRAGVAPAKPAAAVWVECVFVLDITRLFDGNLALGCEQQPMPRRAGG